MAKLTLSTIGSAYASADKHNDNYSDIEEAFENTLSRDGTSPNTMGANIDFNDNTGINVADPTLGHHIANKDYVDTLIADLDDGEVDISIITELDNIEDIHESWHSSLEATIDQGSDKPLFWDESAGVITGLTLGTGLSISGTTLSLDVDISDIGTFSPTDNSFIVGTGAAWALESNTTARTSLGVGTGDSPQFTAVNVGNASDTTLSRASAGVLQVESNALWSAGHFAAPTNLVSLNSVPKFADFEASGYPTLAINTTGPILLTREGGTEAGAANVADLFLLRRADYTDSGTVGFVNSALKVQTIANASAKNAYEWASLFIMDTSHTSVGENVATYAQSHKRAVGGGTWAGVNQLLDYTADPTGPSVGLELEISGVGADTNTARVVNDVWSKRLSGGATAVITYGVRINPETNSTITNGLYFNPGAGGSFTNFINSSTGSFVVTSAGNLTAAAVTATGAFTSLGIDDNATAERLQLSDSGQTWGASGVDAVVTHTATDRTIQIMGGNSSTNGAGIVLPGSTHATFPSTGALVSGSTTTLLWGANTGLANGQWIYVNTSAGAAATPVILRNASSTANTEVVLQFNPSAASTRFAEIVSTNNGSNVTNLVFRPGSGGALLDALTLAQSGVHTMIGALRASSSLAIPAGGTAGQGWMFSSTTNFGTFFGSGAPSLAAAKGSLYLRSDGSGVNDRAYINTDGGTTWTAVVTVG